MGKSSQVKISLRLDNYYSRKTFSYEDQINAAIHSSINGNFIGAKLSNINKNKE